MTQSNWQDINYLSQGNPRQRAAYLALQSLRIFEKLNIFHPVLVGTIPLAIDIPSSDLDIICDVPDVHSFLQIVQEQFGHCAAFQWQTKEIDGLPTVIARFRYQDFDFEIFGQPCPVDQQAAFLHLQIEAQLLAEGGEIVRTKIHELKWNGVKTEPAFAIVFALVGNPYQTLLHLAKQSSRC